MILHIYCTLFSFLWRGPKIKVATIVFHHSKLATLDLIAISFVYLLGMCKTTSSAEKKKQDILPGFYKKVMRYKSTITYLDINTTKSLSNCLISSSLIRTLPMSITDPGVSGKVE